MSTQLKPDYKSLTGLPSSLNDIILHSIRKNWNLMALSDMGGASFTFAELAENVAKLHILFQAAGIKPGDRIAICGKNSAEWAIAFVACLTAGAVAVPILHEFKPGNIHNLLNHSEAKLIFADSHIWEKLDPERLALIQGIILLSATGMPFCRNKKLEETYAHLNEEFGKKFPAAFTPEQISYYKDNPDDLCVINYTSGSTGASKGVMLPYRSLWSNIVYCIEDLTFLKPGDGMVNMLPLGHLYGMVIEMLHPLVKGCHCCFITKAPSPAVIIKAFAEVRPKLIITVPLVLEKIIRSRVFPKLKKPMMRFLLAIPGIRGKVLGKVSTTLMNVFGGQLQEIIIGGAPLNGDVEKFLHDIKFPVTVGYGMTECGPLITYAPPAETRPHSVGRIVDRMEVKIDSPDPQNIPGNILVRGANVMQGYYKNPDATKEAFAYGDGWMNTGDMGTIAEDGTIAISGRSKTMILGPTGQNIYPEEIEQHLNALPFVSESLVIDNNGRLRALIYPDQDALDKSQMNREELEKTMKMNIDKLNRQMEAYNKISDFKIMETEFEKTPKRSIKRYLYQNLTD